MKTEIVDALEISLGAGWTGSVNGSEDRGKGTEAGWLEPPGHPSQEGSVLWVSVPRTLGLGLNSQ